MPIVYRHGWHDRSTSAAWLENRGLRLGDGLFETIRVLSGRPLFVAEHLQRLQRGLAALGLDTPPELSPGAWPALLAELIAQNGFTAGAKLRLTLWRVGGEGSYRPMGRRADFLLEGSELLLNAYTVARDVRLVVSRDVRIHPWALSGLKTLSALPYVQAAREAQAAGADDALLLGPDADVVETGRANLFAVIDGTLVTPPLSTGALDGVLRRVLIGACAQRRVPVVERRLSLAEVLTAEALVTTNVVSGLLPVRHLDVPDSLHAGPGRSYDPQHPLIEAAHRALLQRVKGETQSELFA